MAATWIKPLHISKTMTKSGAIAAVIDYIENPEKTDAGRLISSYACDVRSADDEFLLAKKEYEHITGRSQGRRDVIAYHIRQSFKPGEITPEEANKIGYELATTFTKGRHAFIVATHIDKAHIHNHIVFNSTSLNYERKFKNFFFSNRAVRHISDLLCAEHGLSVIENPGQSKGSYSDWLGENKKPTHIDTVRRKIDEIVPLCATFEDFLKKLRADGYEVNEKRKHVSVKAPGRGKSARLDSLGADYTEAAIRARLGIARVVNVGDGGTNVNPENAKLTGHVSLLIDIQAKLREGKGEGYAQWSKVFNLKESARTLIFLKENGIDSYDDLVKKSSSASGDFAALTKRIKEIESRQKEITELQKQIASYGKTRDVYAKYKASGWSRGFYDVHSTDIILHRSAKKYFDGLGMKKLPSINELKQEYATIAADKKKLYGGYHELKDLSRELAIARSNAERMLGITRNAQTRDSANAQARRGSREI